MERELKNGAICASGRIWLSHNNTSRIMKSLPAVSRNGSELDVYDASYQHDAVQEYVGKWRCIAMWRRRNSPDRSLGTWLLKTLLPNPHAISCTTRTTSAAPRVAPGRHNDPNPWPVMTTRLPSNQRTRAEGLTICDLQCHLQATRRYDVKTVTDTKSYADFFSFLWCTFQIRLTLSSCLEVEAGLSNVRITSFLTA